MRKVLSCWTVLVLCQGLFMQGILTGAPESIDLAPLRKHLKERVEQRQVAGGAILLIHRGRTIMHEGFGYASLKTERPFPRDAECILASISKPILGTVIFRLVAQDQLDLDRPIDAYLPEFKNLKLESGEPARRAPTTRELLTHTSGMRKIGADGGTPWFAKWTRGKSGKSLEYVVERYARRYKLHFNPGTDSAYSGVGYDVAARVAEVQAGMPRNELLQKEFCRPLGLDHTYYRDRTRERENPPVEYRRNKKGKLVRRRKKPYTPPENGYTSSGGAIHSTARDVGVWLMMIRNNGKHRGKTYLPETYLREMLSRGVKHSRKASGGFSVKPGKRPGHPSYLGHTGSTGTFCWIDFDLDLIGVVLTQTLDYGSFRRDTKKLTRKLIRQE